MKALMYHLPDEPRDQIVSDHKIIGIQIPPPRFSNTLSGSIIIGMYLFFLAYLSDVGFTPI